MRREGESPALAEILTEKGELNTKDVGEAARRTRLLRAHDHPQIWEVNRPTPAAAVNVLNPR